MTPNNALNWATYALVMLYLIFCLIRNEREQSYRTREYRRRSKELDEAVATHTAGAQKIEGEIKSLMWQARNSGVK